MRIEKFAMTVSICLFASLARADGDPPLLRAAKGKRTRASLPTAAGMRLLPDISGGLVHAARSALAAKTAPNAVLPPADPAAVNSICA